MRDKIKHLQGSNFDAEVLQANGPVLVDFWAEWCSPCKAIAPILNEIADEYAGKLTVAKLNIDGHIHGGGREIAVEYSVRSIPTLLLFKEGKIVATRVGGLSKDELKKFLDANL
ncbi:thioredoxin TrxA [Candidatus Fukatsuia symbiotica]|uniref:Thioredoxin n=1 Tax=Candidatus Fukatsuia symbiotica TaxID=1878942 RepID=A0A2U8I746_9GAMM|nr:thioredoxin TrxA [Candidatus Fukatsuia symbiotica]AWK14996.1 thioredoxin [Candidatus Fukatsuia symbiotica]MEA9443788.1 thioredoxin TrxA [Candidatus Fukatsuia symbiotica]